MQNCDGVQILGIHTRVPSGSELQRLLSAAADSPLTYDHVGSTLSVGHPRPSERSRSTVLDGRGDSRFRRAVEGLRLWLPQRHLGGFVHPPDAPLAFGTNVLVVLRIGPFAVVAPDRVVAVVDEPDRFGFAYGTLEGHAERGEESFLLERQESGAIRYTIRVDARPATLPARLAHPAVLGVQRWALGRYLDAIRRT